MKDWTVMVYMAGDNNLSENMAFSLEGLAAFPSFTKPGDNSNINLLAYFDGASLTAPTYYLNYSDLKAGQEAERHAVTQDDLFHPDAAREKIVDPQGDVPERLEQNSASAYSILNFVRWCIESEGCVAKNYAIIFSGHSFGFHGTSFMRDESSGSYLTLFKFRWALEKANELYLKDQENSKIAILGFDSCVMSMLEVGYELKDVAQTIVASEGSLPNSGWGYAPMLKEFITCNPRSSNGESSYAVESAKEFVEAFTNHQASLAIGGRSVDISAWNLVRVGDLVKSVNTLAVELNKHLDLTEKYENESITDADIRVYQELKKILLLSHIDTQTYMHEQCVDLKDFCLRLVLECKFMEGGQDAKIFDEIKSLCGNIIDQVDTCVLKCGYSGDEYQFSNGISLYFPWSHLTYFLTDFRYRYLRFNRGSGNRDPEKPQGDGKDWNAFLYNYLTRVTLRRARKEPDGKVSALDSISKSNPPWSKSNPPWSRSNPPWSKSNPPWSRSNPPWSKSNPPWSKSNPPWSRGEVGEYLFYFGRFKNFEMRWDINGFSDEKLPDASSVGDVPSPDIANPSGTE
jgi:Clostripain family